MPVFASYNTALVYNNNKVILNSGYKLAEIAIIGDSMTDDVVCGNRIGITTILTATKKKTTTIKKITETKFVSVIFLI